MRNSESRRVAQAMGSGLGLAVLALGCTAELPVEPDLSIQSISDFLSDAPMVIALIREPQTLDSASMFYDDDEEEAEYDGVVYTTSTSADTLFNEEDENSDDTVHAMDRDLDDIPALPGGYQALEVLSRREGVWVLRARRADAEEPVLLRLDCTEGSSEGLTELAVLAAVEHPGIAELLDHGPLPGGGRFVALRDARGGRGARDECAGGREDRRRRGCGAEPVGAQLRSGVLRLRPRLQQHASLWTTRVGKMQHHD